MNLEQEFQGATNGQITAAMEEAYNGIRETLQSHEDFYTSEEFLEDHLKGSPKLRVIVADLFVKVRRLKALKELLLMDTKDEDATIKDLEIMESTLSIEN